MAASAEAWPRRHRLAGWRRNLWAWRELVPPEATNFISLSSRRRNLIIERTAGSAKYRRDVCKSSRLLAAKRAAKPSASGSKA